MLLHIDKINYPSLINLSNQLYTCEHESEIYSALLHSVMGKLLAQRAMLVTHTSADKFTVQYSLGKNPFSYHSLDVPLENVDLSLIEEFYQHCYSFNVKGSNKKCSIYFSIMNSTGNTLYPQQSDYLELVTQIASSALSNLFSKRDLTKSETIKKRNTYYLGQLMTVNGQLISATSIPEIVSIFNNTIMGLLGITKLALFFEDADNGFIEHTNSFRVQFPKEMLERFYEFDDPADKTSLGLKCELCNVIEHYIPIKHNGRKHGFVLLGKKMNQAAFSEEEKMFANGIASAVMGAIINQQLTAEMIEKKYIEKELEIALEIQNNLMPKSSPIIPGYSICAESIPSRQVGGDYYDIIQISEDKYLIIIADVSGKGIPAALLMANVQAACRVLAAHAMTLNELLNSVNILVYQNTPAERFVTLFAAVLDVTKNTLKYSNAGHNPPVYITSDGSVRKLDKGGVILGLFDMDIKYEQEIIQLDNNSIVCLYTDGIVECPQNLDLELSEEKLAQYIIDNYSLPPSDIMKGIYSAISNTTGNKINYDDQTMIFIKRD